VLGGHAIGQLVGVTAAPLVRSGQLVPVLTGFIPRHLGLYVYYGSRAAQPARVRAFIDLAVEMLADNPVFSLNPQELAEAAPRPGRRRQSAT
jgi:DNA-binding transcriptional LysR family regulator